MHEPSLFEIFVAPLQQANIEFMVTGSVASIVYGKPRLTHDIDLVLSLTNDQVPLLCEQFPPETFACPLEDTLRVEVARSSRGHFNIIQYDTGFKADVYLCANDELMKWGLANVRSVKFSNIEMPIAPPEYVITKKLQYYQEGRSEKHLLDIIGILEETELNKPILDSLINKYGLQISWEAVFSLIESK